MSFLRFPVPFVATHTLLLPTVKIGVEQKAGKGLLLPCTVFLSREEIFCEFVFAFNESDVSRRQHKQFYRSTLFLSPY